MKVLREIRDRLKNRPDSEHEQILLRILIGSLILILLFSSLTASEPPTILLRNRLAFIVFVIFSLGLFIDMLRREGIHPARRILGMTADLGVLTYLLTSAGGWSTPLVVIYLWVTMGNGFRYGVKYLFLSAGFSITGLTIVFLNNPYWSTRPMIFASFQLANFVLPLYVAVLLKKLQNQIELARSANLAKSQFFATVSHELRTPLNVLVGCAELLSGTSLDREQKTLICSLRASGAILLGLIENILDMSRIEAGKLKIEQEEFNLFSLLLAIMASTEPLLRSKNLSFSLSPSSNLPGNVMGDRRHLEQILVNLVGNAIKFTEKGRIDVRILCRGTDTKTTTVRFEVYDTGIGIPESVQPLIFERFIQSDHPARHHYKGTGLGTSIARELVENMGGTIGFWSKPDTGSMFWFEVPLALCEAPISHRPRAASFDGLRALMIAPIAGADSIRKAFSSLGMSVTHQETVGAGFYHLAQTGEKDLPFDLVILDQDLMRLEGRSPNADLTSEISSGYETPLIVVSDSGLPNEEEACAFPKMSSIHLSRPLEEDLVLSVLQSFFDPSAQRVRNEILAPSSVPKTILIAEDNPINQMVVTEILKRAGHHVLLAHNGEEALEYLENQDLAYDALILDYHMPDRGGLDVVRMYRFMEPHSTIPIIILTASVTPDIQEACRNAGVDAFMSKPVNSRALLDTIDRLVSHQRKEENRGVTTGKAGTAEREEPASAIDRKVFFELCELSSNPNFIKELAGHFQHDGQHLLSGMKKAWEQENRGKLDDLAHALKGCALQIGAATLVRKCSDIRRTVEPDGSLLSPYKKILAAEEAFLEATRELEFLLSSSNKR